MPNTANAKKALRKSEQRRLRNRSRRSALRTTLKRVRSAVEAGNQEAAQDAFRLACKKLDQSAAKNLIHKNAAARTKSRLSALIKKSFAQPAAE
jgi:small subunit ribosomal protein S20